MCEIEHLTLHRLAQVSTDMLLGQDALNYTATCQKNPIWITANIKKSSVSLGVCIILHLICNFFHGMIQSNSSLWLVVMRENLM